jgi:CARDB protein
MPHSWNSNVSPAREITTEPPAARWRLSFTFCANYRRVAFLSVLLLTLFLAQLHMLAQTSVTTWHYDNARTSADTSETTLTLSNVNSTRFGKLFTYPVDGIIVGHPLYLPNVSIPGQGVHNVVYVCTMHDSIYAFDADNGNPTPLWTTSIFSYSPAGATSVPANVTQETGIKWTEVGIISTPVIDPETGTLYLVAETYENVNVVHRLHALDVTTGQEKFGGPTTIVATYTLNGTTTRFADLYQINRPGLLLANGHIYIGFGSNCCNAYSQGWVLSYNAATLQQEGTYTSEPGKTLASIWQKGAGLSSDSNGSIYGETGEGFYSAGTNLSISVLKINQLGTTLALGDWFTPYNRQNLSQNDQDLNNAPVILPDQTGPYVHELIAVGKEGTIYVLNRDSMGQFCSSCTAGDTQIAQEIPQGAGKGSGTPVYWNNTVYFTAENSPVQAYTISNGTLVVPPFLEPIQIGGGGHAIITANGNSNGILWFINGGGPLWALDAITLKTLYTSGQAANGRDTLPPLAHFATPIAADGKVFIGTQNSLVVYGLLPLPNLPDLTETSVTDPPATALDGSTFSVSDMAQNIGTVTAAASTTRYYLSTTPSKSSAHLLTGSRAVPSLAQGASSGGTVTVTVKAGTAGGNYFLLACADGASVVSEMNESNNCKASAAQVTISGPDLVETGVSDPPTTVTPGGTFSVSDTVQNIGTVTAAASTTLYYLSTTTSKSGSSIHLTGSRSVPSLAPATVSSGNASVTVPSTLPSGAYFLLACSDDRRAVSETNETNNCKASATTTMH